jgi:citronellol/citronellal dehydrogenase
MSAALSGKVVFITGASRGIGRAIALAAAREGADVVVAAKTVEPHPKLPGTIHTVADEIRSLGRRALPIQLDVREEFQVADAVAATEKEFGRLDALVNNAGAIGLTTVEQTAVKRFDLMQEVNSRALFLCAKAALPLMRKAGGGHIISLSPPLNLDPRWLGAHAPYTLSKYGMTLLALGMAAEFAPYQISVSTLWPRTTIATAAIEFAVGGSAVMKRSRKVDIMADAALEILRTRNGSLNGRCLIDEELLRERGTTDFRRYAADPAHADALFPDLFVGEPAALELSLKK